MSVTATARRRRRMAKLDPRYRTHSVSVLERRKDVLVSRQREMALRKGKKR